MRFDQVSAPSKIGNETNLKPNDIFQTFFVIDV